MKQINVKFVALFILMATLWSCQTEQVVSNAVAATTKKQPLPDGVPSDADDYLNFDTKKYFHAGQQIQDTTAIKKMLSQATGVETDENNNVNIYLTKAEATDLESRANASNPDNEANKAALVDGDNYLVYFFEINTVRKDYGVEINSQKYYANKLGPLNYENTSTNLNWKYYIGTNYCCVKVVNVYELLNYYYENPSAGVVFNTYYTVNVYNPTRYSRRVYFYNRYYPANSPAKYYWASFVVPSKKSISIGGTLSKFNGTSLPGVRILHHHSDKI
jgi:hypothetical protein